MDLSVYTYSRMCVLRQVGRYDFIAVSRLAERLLWADCLLARRVRLLAAACFSAPCFRLSLLALASRTFWRAPCALRFLFGALC